MKTIGVRALRENPGVLSRCAAKGEYVLVTNRNNPVSLAVPFTDELLNAGVHINMAVKLYEDGIITLTKAATLGRVPVETFLQKLAMLGIVVVDQSAGELDADLDALSD
ncbi:MAG: UPF0175 family protein [Exilibacterium sp.]